MDEGQRGATGHHQAAGCPWWKTDAAGQVVMSVRFGARPIEFEKLFSQAAKTGSIGKARKAA
jgi:hypothetical protein